MRAPAVVRALMPTLALALLSAVPATAQRVVADVRVVSGPVVGHVMIGNHAVHRVAYRGGRVVRVVDQYAPVVIVRHAHAPRGHAHGWWKRHGYRPVVLYEAGGRFYDRWYRGVPGLREVVVYQRGGRYYLPQYVVQDRRHDRGDRYDRGDDRYDRRDWYDADRDDWYDDRDDRDRNRGRGR